MNRAQLEHVIRAAATIAGDSEIVVRTAVRAGLVERGVLLERLEKTPLDTERRRRIRAQIDADFTGA